MKKLTILVFAITLLTFDMANAESGGLWASTDVYGGRNRVNNINIATKAINGVIIRPGQEFSYNKVVGERNEENGFKEADSFLKGETVKTIGGGICQVSSTLFMEIKKFSKIVITEHHKHSREVKYGKNGADATVSWGTKDFKFKNELGYPIKIIAKVSEGRISVRLIKAD